MQNLEFPMRIKYIPKFHRLNNLKMNVFDFTGSVLSPVHTKTRYTEPQIALMYENHYCLTTKLHR